MRRRVLAGLLMLAAFSAGVQGSIDASRLMSQLSWEKRVLLVFAAHRQDADYRQQSHLLATINDGLVERDMTVIRVFADGRVVVDGQSYQQSAASFYRRFSVPAGDFRVILVGKDGSVKLDRSDVVSDEELFILIDSMPMRRNEMLRDG